MATRVTVAPQELLPVFAALCPRPKLQAWLKAVGYRRYWRAFTPLIVLWGMIYQRLHADASCDAALVYLRSGAADELDAADPHALPLSQRLRSENTSAYVQGRIRLPLALVRHLCLEIAQVIVPPTARPAAASWHGRRVRWLDGTTFRLRPVGDLPAVYGQAANNFAQRYWVVPKAVAVFDLFQRVCTDYSEGPRTTSEPALAAELILRAREPHTLFVGDAIYGVYRVVQVAMANGHDVLTRLAPQTAAWLWHRATPHAPRSGQTVTVGWSPVPAIVVEPGLAPLPLLVRVLYVHLCRPGFRPVQLYLVTTLHDATAFPLADLVALYGLRWEVEINFRHIKSTLDMAEFAVQSAAMFRLELAVSMLAYNLVCLLMAQAAATVHLSPARLSFACCLRRLQTLLFAGFPAAIAHASQSLLYLLHQLAACRLPRQPNKVAHEPRRQRYRARFPPLVGDRQTARQKLTRPT